MAARNTQPIFSNTPRIGTAAFSTANTNRDGTGTIADVLTGAAEGTRINRLWVQATGTTTAGMVRVYVYDGSAYRLVKEISVSALTPSATVKAFTDEWVPDDLDLPSATYKLAVSTHNAEQFIAVALGGDYS